MSAFERWLFFMEEHFLSLYFEIFHLNIYVFFSEDEWLIFTLLNICFINQPV